jgi:hypothetical protein
MVSDFGCLLNGRRSFDGFDDAGMGAAAANVADVAFDVLVAGIGNLLDEFGCRHHEAGLTISTLGHFFFDPGLLDGVNLSLGGQALQSRHLLTCGILHGQGTRTVHLAIHMQGAGTTHGPATAKFGGFELQLITNHPEQGHFGVNIYADGFFIDAEIYFHDLAFELYLYHIVTDHSILKEKIK